MRFIMALFWAILISSALTYVLNSMANDPFNLTQAFGYAAAVFIGIIAIDGILSAQSKKIK